MNCIVLLAAPAAGKGTISKYISDNYNFDHISTGDLLREEVSLKTETGLKIEKLLSKGELVSDEIVYKNYVNMKPINKLIYVLLHNRNKIYKKIFK